MLEGKNVVIGVTGGIAVYKSVEIVSRLKKLGADVYVIMTKSATEFVKPMTFQSLSHNPVVVEMFGRAQYWDVEHISLADKADLMLIAPATANIVGKIANGIADDMLSTTVMATQAPVVLCPAMNVNMYSNSIFQDNLSYLREKDYKIIEADAGYLACGYEGRGRLSKPLEIVETSIAYLLAPEEDLNDRKVLITAGGTMEALDPVRYLGNHSSGKMGYALARIAQARGADVTLISAPTTLNDPKGVKKIEVRTAAEMEEMVLKYKAEQDIIIMAAAVADYRPKDYSDNKIKKESGDLVIRLERTEDILAKLGKDKDNQILVGFAAESDNLVENAKDKLARKNADLIVANDITSADTGFAADNNKVIIISKDREVDIPKASKLEVAKQIIDQICEMILNN
ncbi:bifunctional phosphopantothenoylcysteine decarboxylase/phosphopantothenate--cysteine ligase CoaBC [Orenia marismortui]|uniref:Coenzyme A biosynthesis bifunctional protein CoaBC n=1 Tax=Orenia marismortui TaxID=46469 RepID=A0A4R8GVM8_9FIRM|nr:bifunctional phosphopantothenoylcysteine decarboxylase/phosphopantothenate--cysteine ligase CoaBC [Orenia marismortui]TDX46751.1 phosphopantothenate-cysteine ligase /phosphopantothenoylcysteine decarboxylase [Orenia marismortui]